MHAERLSTYVEPIEPLFPVSCLALLTNYCRLGRLPSRGFHTSVICLLEPSMRVDADSEGPDVSARPLTRARGRSKRYTPCPESRTIIPARREVDLCTSTTRSRGNNVKPNVSSRCVDYASHGAVPVLRQHQEHQGFQRSVLPNSNEISDVRPQLVCPSRKNSQRGKAVSGKCEASIRKVED